MRYSINQKISHYRIVDFIGAGGMGEVYRAIQDSIERIVALKILSNPEDSADFTQRFLNEARIHARFQHPNIVLLYDFFEYAGMPCIAMEYVSGRGLDELINENIGLPLSDAVFIFKSIVNAISYIHSNGVLHRDIKPGNIRIDQDDSIKLLDFGIAKDIGGNRLTQAGCFVGTLQYLAPEQLSGNSGDQRSDIWSLGVLFYEMLTGKLPFKENSLTGFLDDIQNNNFSKNNKRLSNVPEDAKNIILQCLNTKPSKRYQSALLLEQDISRLQMKISSPKLACIGAGDVKNVQLERFNKRMLIMLSLAAVIFVIVMTGLIFFQDPQPIPKPQPMPVVQPVKPLNPVPNHKMAKVRISILGNSNTANIYSADGKILIGQTPYETQAAVGSRLKYILKSKGCKSQPIEFTVNSVQNDMHYSPLKRE